MATLALRVKLLVRHGLDLEVAERLETTKQVLLQAQNKENLTWDLAHNLRSQMAWVVVVQRELLLGTTRPEVVAAMRQLEQTESQEREVVRVALAAELAGVLTLQQCCLEGPAVAV
jgi:hypothetical protein